MAEETESEKEEICESVLRKYLLEAKLIEFNFFFVNIV